MTQDLTRRIGTNELSYVQEVLRTEFRSSSGSTFMRRLEEEFAKRFNSTYAISFVNGTATMHAALEATWPAARAMRRLMFPPMRPRPTIPSVLVIGDCSLACPGRHVGAPARQAQGPKLR